jgi:chitinase/chitodextrinase
MVRRAQRNDTWLNNDYHALFMRRHYTPAAGRLAYRRWFAVFLMIFCITAVHASSPLRDERCVACTDPVWTAASTYTGGVRVSLNNKIYEARWWTQGENPETRSGEWDVWRYIGPCDGGGTNINPTVSLTAPANGASFTAPASVMLTATASDADGTVAKVGFYQGATLLGEDTSAPYSYTWSSVPAGTYALRAVATDNAGATGTSATASVTVNGNTGGGCNIPTYANGSAYSTGDEVQYNNKKYKCEVGGWCSLGGAYEPGIGWAWDNAWELLGDCTGGNNGPSVAITAPTAGTNFPVGQSITIAATASDADGSITKVEFFVDGAKIGEDASAPYSISWTSTQGYHTLVARATDNSGFTNESAAVSITAGDVNTGGLPARIMSGYWHTWGGGVPFVKLRDVSPRWDVINISFVEPVTVGSTNGQVKFVLAGATADYTIANFKSDIKLLQSQGKKIVISIGGYEGYFSLTTAAARATFVSNMKSIIDEYGFDGIDIDLEQSSLELETGDADFRNPTSPKVVQMIGAIRDLCNHYGSNFILTFAPEAFYLQLGYQWYAGLHSSVDRRAGVYIPVIHALRDKITYVQSQLYNQPAIMGLNGTLYSSGNPDYLVSMTDMLLKGFNVGGNPSYFFPPLRPDQVVIAVPSSAGAAGSGQVTNQQLQQAFSYIVKGQSYGGQYTMTGTYPALRGIMAWSINWDVLQNNNGFVNANRTYLDGLGAPAAGARAAAPVASVQAAAVPAGWGDFQMGLVSDNTNIINVRMKKALQENVKLNYRYAYVNNGVDPSSNALSWLFNQWGTDYSRNSQEMGLRPAYVIYMLQEEGGAAALKNNIRNADFMRKYFSSIRTVAEKSNGYKAIFVIEPDTWGYFLQNALEQGTTSDPRQVPATVSNLGAGYEHLAGLPNTLSGVAQGIIRTLRRYAPDSYNGLLMSFWSVNGNGVTGPPVADGAKGMVYWNQGDVTYSAQRNVEFANQLLPATGDRGDFIGVEKNGWSAGNWLVKQNRNDYYWNDTQNAKWVSWSKTLSQGVNLPLLGWQISIGHMGLPNTVNRYEDTFMPYFFTHKQEFFDAGFIGFLAGKGLADCTDFTNLNGNSLESNGNAGDNGWFFEQLKAFDAGRPYLTGVTPPSVSITSPAAQRSFTAPAAIEIAATAGAGTGGTIAKVEFFQGTVKLGEDTSAPYAFTWTNVGAGSYSLTAKVTTATAAAATSSAVAIMVTVPNTNTPPVVSLTSPASGGTAYTAPATVVLGASASDNGVVAKVEFFQGSVKLGEDTSAPYAYTWSGVAAGSYALTARATDSEGLSTTSAAVNITVTNPTGGCTGVPQYVENSGYVAGSQVQQGGSIYQCREWPYSGWCNGAAWAYGPGTGMYWQDAWVLKGACGAQQRVATAEAFAVAGATITLYPNPGESNRVNVVTIDFTQDAGDVAVQVVKVDGSQLVDRKYQGVQRSLRVEVPALPGGLYLIRVGAGAQSGLLRYLVR